MPDTAFARLVTMSQALFMVVDPQERLMPHISGNAEVAANIARLIEFAKLAEIPLLGMKQIKMGAYAGELEEKMAGVRVWEKSSFSCLANEEFAEALNASRRKQLVLFGVETHICVLQTAMQALARGYEVFAVADACGCRNPENHRLACARLSQAGAWVVSAEMVIFEALGQAGTDLFRAALPLVK